MTTEQAGLSPEAQKLLNIFMVLDNDRAGVGLDKIRVFYPKVAWSVILEPAKELEAAGRLTRKPVLNAKGRVGYELYTWKEA